jgi:hypothetical protein
MEHWQTGKRKSGRRINRTRATYKENFVLAGFGDALIPMGIPPINYHPVPASRQDHRFSMAIPTHRLNIAVCFIRPATKPPSVADKFL